MGICNLSFIAMVDVLFISYGAWNAIRNDINSIEVVILLSYISCKRMGEMNHNLASMVHLAANSRKFIKSLKRHIPYFISDHHRLRSFAEHINQLGVSDFMFVAFFTNIVVNVILFNLLLIRQLELAEQLVIVIVLEAQFIFGMLAPQILINWADGLSGSDSLLYRTQGLIGRKGNFFALPSVISAKIRLLRFFEVICTKDRYHFTMGPSAKITKRSLYEV